MDLTKLSIRELRTRLGSSLYTDAHKQTIRDELHKRHLNQTLTSNILPQFNYAKT